MKKKPPEPKSFPLWQSTFSDLMNLLLCFFVLLFSMSTINEEKYLQVVNSLKSAFTTILSTGGSTIVPAELVSSGITQLPDFSDYFGDTMSKGESGGESDTGSDEHLDEGENEHEDVSPVSPEEEAGKTGSDTQVSEEVTVQEATEALEKAAINESEEMAEAIEAMTTQLGIQDMVEIDFNGQYVRITLSGALLFDSGQSDLRLEAVPIVQKLGTIMDGFPNNLIEIEGHTDNVPIRSAKYEDNEVLSMYRARTVANLVRDSSTINDGHVVSTGRADYDPIADNGTPEGRSRNRRVELKVYNSFSSGDLN